MTRWILNAFVRPALSAHRGCKECFCSTLAYYFPLPAIDLSQGLKVMLSVGENLTIEYIADDAALSGEVDLGLTSD